MSQNTTAAQQGVAYAEMPTSNYAGRVHEEGFLIGTCPLYTADQLHAFADATYMLRASRGQAPAGAGEAAEHYRNAIARARLLDSDLSQLTERGAKAWAGVDAQALREGGASLSANAGQAGEYPALVCDYCGALTPDPWHSSGMLRGKMSKHIHSCDACAPHGQAPAGAWIERWHGSGGKDGYEGWSIVNKDDRALVAYLGRGVDSEAVTKIVMAHNATSAASHGQAPAQAARADSAQEDAALWHWLAEYLVGTRTDLDDEIVACETVNDLRKLVEAAIKQGEKQ